MVNDSLLCIDCARQGSDSKKHRNVHLSALFHSTVEDFGPNLVDAHSFRPAMQAWCNVILLKPGSLLARTDPTLGPLLEAPNTAPQWMEGTEAATHHFLSSGA